MTDSFADAAARWCGLAARFLGWKPADFWNATPAELTMALVDPMIATLMERDADGR